MVVISGPNVVVLMEGDVLVVATVGPSHVKTMIVGGWLAPAGAIPGNRSGWVRGPGLTG